MSMAMTLNSITRVFSVLGMVPQQQQPVVSHTPSFVSLCLVVHNRRRVLYRDSLGAPRVILDEIAGVRRVHAPDFDALDLYDPDTMCTILCDALGLDIDEDSLYGLGSELLNCFLGTRSRNLCAEFEVARDTVVAVAPGEEEVAARLIGSCPLCRREL